MAGEIFFLSEEGLRDGNGNLVAQDVRIDIYPWYKVLWAALFKKHYRYVVAYKAAEKEHHGRQ